MEVVGKNSWTRGFPTKYLAGFWNCRRLSGKGVKLVSKVLHRRTRMVNTFEHFFYRKYPWPSPGFLLNCIERTCSSSLGCILGRRDSVDFTCTQCWMLRFKDCARSMRSKGSWGWHRDNKERLIHDVHFLQWVAVTNKSVQPQGWIRWPRLSVVKSKKMCFNSNVQNSPKLIRKQDSTWRQKCQSQWNPKANANLKRAPMFSPRRSLLSLSPIKNTSYFKSHMCFTRFWSSSLTWTFRSHSPKGMSQWVTSFAKQFTTQGSNSVTNIEPESHMFAHGFFYCDQNPTHYSVIWFRGSHKNVLGMSILPRNRQNCRRLLCIMFPKKCFRFCSAIEGA